MKQHGKKNKNSNEPTFIDRADLQKKGMNCYNNRDYAGAVYYYTESLSDVLPTNTTIRYPALYMRGVCNNALGNYALAIQDLKEARGLLHLTASKTDKYDTDIQILNAQFNLIRQDPKSPNIDALYIEIIERSSTLLINPDPTFDKKILHDLRLKACLNYINNHNDDFSYNGLVIEDTSYLINKMNDEIDNNNGKNKAFLFYCLRSSGTAHLRANNFEMALESYNHIDERFRSKVDWEFMTRAYVGVGKYHEALECAAKIPPKKPGVSITPNTNTLLFLIAKSTAEISTERHEDAIKTLQKMISLSPDDAYIYANLAVCYQELLASDRTLVPASDSTLAPKTVENEELNKSECQEKLYSCILKIALTDTELFREFVGEEAFSYWFAPKEVENLSSAGEKNSTDEGGKETVTTISDEMSLVVGIETLKVQPAQPVETEISDDIDPDADYRTYLSYIKKPAQSYIHKLSRPEPNAQTLSQIIEWNVPSDHRPVPAMDGINKGFGKAWSDRLSSNSELYTYFDKTSKTIADLRASKKSDHGLYKKLKEIIRDGHIVGSEGETGIKLLKPPIGMFTHEAKICGDRGKNTRVYGQPVSSVDGKHILLLFRECGDAMHR